MKIIIAATVTALAAAVVVLTSAPRGRHESGHFRAAPVAASPSGSPQPASGALSRPLEGDAPFQPQSGTPLPRSEPVNYDVPDATAAPAVLPPPDPQVAALQQLVAQSRQESEQLRQIDDHLAALRQLAADEEARRQDEADQEAAQHAATLEALGTLRQAEALLATGNWDGVDDELGRAEAALSGRTRLDVEAAREALARSDLFPARQYLAAALAERRFAR
jgi:hypothetical protein